MYKNKDFYGVIMSFEEIMMSYEDIKILEFNQHQKSHRAPSIIYAGLEVLIKIVNRSSIWFWGY